MYSTWIEIDGAYYYCMANTLDDLVLQIQETLGIINEKIESEEHK